MLFKFLLSENHSSSSGIGSKYLAADMMHHCGFIDPYLNVYNDSSLLRRSGALLGDTSNGVLSYYINPLKPFCLLFYILN